VDRPRVLVVVLVEQREVVEVAVGPDLDVDPGIDAAFGQERGHGRGVRAPVGVGEHHEDAADHRVGEEEGVAVAGGEGAAVVDGRAGDGRAAVGRTAGAGAGDPGRSAVGEERLRGRAGNRVEVFAEADPELLEVDVRVVAFEAGPARVVGAGRFGREPVDLLGRPAADVVDVDLVGLVVDREAEGVAKAEADDPPLVGVGAGGERVVRPALARVRVDADHGAVEPSRVDGVVRVEGGEHVLGAQRAALGDGRRKRFAAGRVAALVPVRPAELAVVGGGEAGAVAAAGEQRPFGAELEVADRVRGGLLAPAFDQDGLGGGGGAGRGVVAFGGEPDEAAADRAGVDVGVGRFRAGIADIAVFRHAPVRKLAGGFLLLVLVPADHVVEGVEGVDVGAGRKIGVEDEPEDTAVAVVVGLLAEVREQGRRGVVQPVEDEDPAGLLGDENAPIGSEAERRRFLQVVEGDRVLEADGQAWRRHGGAGKNGGEEAQDREGFAERADRPKPSRAPAGPS
jgi:hypothetical protein